MKINNYYIVEFYFYNSFKFYSWKQKDYSNLHHNCQHFAVEIIKILNPQFNNMGIMPGENASLIEGKDEEQIIPSVILEQLKKNMV